MSKLIGKRGEFSNAYQELQGVWKIADFFSLSKDKNRYYESTDFTFAEAVWCLRIYAGDHSESREGFIPLFLVGKSGLPKTLEYTFGIKKVDGKVMRVYSDTHNFKENNLGQGVYDFFDRSELLRLKSELAPLDTLTITCHLREGTMLQPIDELELPMKLIELETLSENFKDLLANTESCDVTLQVKNKEFQAHKSVLIARSPVLAAMFQNDMSEKQTGVASIVDCDVDSFDTFLQYLYSGKVENISFCNALHLYVTADKYDVKELKSFCVEFVKRNLMVENVCSAITMAERYDETELLSAAQDFFNQNANEVVSTTEFENLMKENHCLVIKLLKEMTSKVKIQN